MKNADFKVKCEEEPVVRWDEDEERAARWRRAILGLSEALTRAADERPDFASVLMEAMHHALESLLVYGEEGELLALEEWLLQEEADLPNLNSDANGQRA